MLLAELGTSQATDLTNLSSSEADYGKETSCGISKKLDSMTEDFRLILFSSESFRVDGP